MVQSLELLPAEERIESYRNVAATLRKMAERARTQKFCDELDRLAASYETLAKEVARIEAGLSLPGLRPA